MKHGDQSVGDEDRRRKRDQRAGSGEGTEGERAGKVAIVGQLVEGYERTEPRNDNWRPRSRGDGINAISGRQPLYYPLSHQLHETLVLLSPAMAEKDATARLRRAVQGDSISAFSDGWSAYP